MEPRESRGSGPKYKAQRGERSKCAPEESLKKKSLFCCGWVQSTCSRANRTFHCSSSVSELAPFCDQKREDKWKNKTKQHFPFSNILKSNMGKDKSHAGACEEPPHRWKNLLWSRNDHSWGEQEPSFLCDEGLQWHAQFSEVWGTPKYHQNQQQWQMLVFLTEGVSTLTELFITT